MKKRENKAVKKKSLWRFSLKYFLLVLLTSLIILVFVKLGVMKSMSLNPLGIVSVLITFTAGFFAVKEGFSVKQTALIGIICSLGALWLVPIVVFDLMKSIYLLPALYWINFAISVGISAGINMIIYIIAGVLGGLSARSRGNSRNVNSARRAGRNKK